MVRSVIEQLKQSWSTRSVQLGAVVGVSALALCSFAGASSLQLNGGRAQPMPASHAQLSIVLQPAPDANATPRLQGQLATLDPEQTRAPVQTSHADAIDPGLRAVLEEERRNDLHAQAKYRAFMRSLNTEPTTPVAEPAPQAPSEDPGT